MTDWQTNDTAKMDRTENPTIAEAEAIITFFPCFFPDVFFFSDIDILFLSATLSAVNSINGRYSIYDTQFAYSRLPLY